MAKSDKKEIDPSQPLENKKHELFCVLFAGMGSRQYFNNGTNCYLYAFGGQQEMDAIDQKLALLPNLAKNRDVINKLNSRRKSVYNTANSNSTRLLINASIKARCNHLLDDAMSNQKMDQEMVKVVNQWWDIPSKVAAYREIMKVKGRLSDKLQGNFTIHWKERKKPEPSKQEIKKEVKKVAAAGIKWKQRS